MTDTTARDAAFATVTEAAATLTRYQQRTGGDWARDGFGIQSAQVAVDKAEADYRSAFAAYTATVTL